jgi:hypothetical protein
VVPSIYAWGSAATESSQDWIFQELMPDTPLDEAFHTLDHQEKKQIFARMVQLLKDLQDCKLPKVITGFGKGGGGRGDP